MARMADITIDVQQVSENIQIITIGNRSMTYEYFENGYQVSAASDNGEITTLEVTKEIRPINDASSRGLSETVVLFEKITFINGTELSRHLLNQTTPLYIENEDEQPGTRGAINYWWDGIYFYEGSGTWDYPHPDINYYGISSSQNWCSTGSNLYHQRLSAANSATFLALPIEVAATVFTTFMFYYVGISIDHPADMIVSELIGNGAYTVVLDEDNCLWWWTSKAFMYDLFSYSWHINYLVHLGYNDSIRDFVNDMLNSNGYYRVAGTTVRDPQHIGNPCPPPTHNYAVSATALCTGNGYINNKDNVIGTADLQYAYLNSGNFGNKADLNAIMNKTVSGQLYVRCYTPSANGANLKIYVCNTAGTWTTVKNTNLYPANTPMSVDCGYVNNIVKVSIVAYHEYSGYPSYIYVDAVCIL